MHSVKVIHDKKQNFSKHRIFPKGLTHAFGQNMSFFLELVSVKIRLEIMFNNVLDTKQDLFWPQKFNLFKSQKSHFSKGGECLR